jgi:hypothetical protein
LATNSRLERKVKNMLNHLMNTRPLRTAVFAAAVGMLTVMVSVPAGAADKPLSKTELKGLISNAETKAEHERIAQYFDAEAAKYETEAKDHADLAQLYQRNTSATPTKHSGTMQTFQHCDSMSKALQQAAENARQLAAEHRDMEREAKK